MNFSDKFSKHSKVYAQYRPNYPVALFDFLATLVDERELAWDCATGNGQAAVELANYFRKVIATDASRKQIEHAMIHEKIEYFVSLAEKVNIPSKTVNLVTVAQALHWFDRSAFYEEVRRVLKTHGVIAVWSYNLIRITPVVDSVIHHLYYDVLGNYWSPERKWVETGYQDIVFPFREVVSPSFVMEKSWTIDQLIGYLYSWSAVQQYQEQEKSDPIEQVVPTLYKTWGDREKTKIMCWDISLRAGFC